MDESPTPTLSTEPLTTPDYAEQARIIESPSEADIQRVASSLGEYSHQQAQRRIQFRQQQVVQLRTEGARPFRVFKELTREVSRADNPDCGINGEADHLVEAQYLAEAAAEATGQEAVVLAWLSHKAQQLALSRKEVKDFLLLDQLTDASTYDPHRTFNEHTFFNSSLGDITFRAVTPLSREIWLEKLTQSKEAVSSWAQFQQEMAEAGLSVVEFLAHPDPKKAESILLQGSSDPATAEKWNQAMETLPEWFQRTLDNIATSDDLPTLDQTLVEFMTNLTGCEAILEEQYAFAGIALIRAAANNAIPADTLQKINPLPSTS